MTAVIAGTATGAKAGDAYQFASGPVEAELTGPYFTPDGNTLFMAVQHPGEETEDVASPTSTWPDGDIPRPAVVAITGFAGAQGSTDAMPAGLPSTGGGGLTTG